MSVLLDSSDTTSTRLQEQRLHPSTENHNDPNLIPAKVTTGKPFFHLTAPHGWINDPCGLGYDPTTGLYHIFFQWNPWGNDWGNMSWGHATSTNLVSWEISPEPAMTPSAEYDCRGVFTGCLKPTDVSGEPGALTAIYTSVSHLPIHFTLPYTYGCESISLSVSKDGGKTWQRQDCNPIVSGPPSHLSVTGWRDPFLFSWRRGRQDGSNDADSDFYGITAGGIVGKAPAIFVYKVDPRDLRQWKYIGPLVDVGLNLRPSRWSGDFGVNWEVSNLLTLSNDSGDSRDFVIMGVEGCLRPANPNEEMRRQARSRRDPRGQMWMSVRARKEHDSFHEPLSEYAFSGYFDHGCLYAANSFWDLQTSSRIVYGWITEEDLPDGPRHRQGWSSMISLPRTVGLMTLEKVKMARNSRLETITSIEAIADSSELNTFTIHTLGIKPDPRLSHLRAGARECCLEGISLLPLALKMSSEAEFSLKTSRWELQTEFAVGKSCKRVGIEIGHSANFEHRTILAWDPSSETFTIHRPPVSNPDINHGHESAPHTLFTFINEQGEVEETLRVHAFFDRSVLEVFVNERTVISTRIYHPSEQCFGVRFFAEAVNGQSSQSATLLEALCWDGLRAKA
ncbi:Glycoside hydrolase family 32 [Penicillium hetheringtonii]|uniref:Glycoside hydrolase family 32 n=1 Tax=Penicillium hetheringtonii TaxID=911720 RepID=A0AAD6DEW0_9EURO|nr:Glycoside hydrolase family 32 [Penicillium hetheringtonii]